MSDQCCKTMSGAAATRGSVFGRGFGSMRCEKPARWRVRGAIGINDEEHEQYCSEHARALAGMLRWPISNFERI